LVVSFALLYTPLGFEATVNKSDDIYADNDSPSESPEERLIAEQYLTDNRSSNEQNGDYKKSNEIFDGRSVRQSDQTIDDVYDSDDEGFGYFKVHSIQSNQAFSERWSGKRILIVLSSVLCCALLLMTIGALIYVIFCYTSVEADASKLSDNWVC
uniref:Uncharacterized protein n=1 Tax=Romanomermis culicivorax TaxID=13658 RepID=A0A915L1H2_ROMCU